MNTVVWANDIFYDGQTRLGRAVRRGDGEVTFEVEHGKDAMGTQQWKTLEGNQAPREFVMEAGDLMYSQMKESQSNEGETTEGREMNVSKKDWDALVQFFQDREHALRRSYGPPDEKDLWEGIYKHIHPDLWEIYDAARKAVERNKKRRKGPL